MKYFKLSFVKVGWIILTCHEIPNHEQRAEAFGCSIYLAVAMVFLCECAAVHGVSRVARAREYRE